MPATDLKGRPVPRSDFYLLTVRCGGCGDPVTRIKALSSADRLPVVIVLTGNLADADVSYQQAPTLRLISDWNGEKVPFEMIRHAPVVSYVGTDGRIQRFPKAGDALESFVKSQRSNK